MEADPVSEAAPRKDSRKGGRQDLTPPPEKTGAVENKATRRGIGTRRDDRVWGCIPRRVWSLGWREDPIPYPKKKLPPTLAYRGTRVGEAKNPGPTEDLDIEILGGTGPGAESGPEGRSRTPPKTADTRTVHKDEEEVEEASGAFVDDLAVNGKRKEKDDGATRWRSRSPGPQAARKTSVKDNEEAAYGSENLDAETRRAR